MILGHPISKPWKAQNLEGMKENVTRVLFVNMDQSETDFNKT